MIWWFPEDESQEGHVEMGADLSLSLSLYIITFNCSNYKKYLFSSNPKKWHNFESLNTSQKQMCFSRLSRQKMGRRQE